MRLLTRTAAAARFVRFDDDDDNRLFDAVNLALTGCQLSPYENLGAMTIKDGKLDLRKLMAILMEEKLFTRPDGRTARTPALPRR